MNLKWGHFYGPIFLGAFVKKNVAYLIFLLATLSAAVAAADWGSLFEPRYRVPAGYQYELSPGEGLGPTVNHCVQNLIERNVNLKVQNDRLATLKLDVERSLKSYVMPSAEYVVHLQVLSNGEVKQAMNLNFKMRLFRLKYMGDDGTVYGVSYVCRLEN